MTQIFLTFRDRTASILLNSELCVGAF